MRRTAAVLVCVLLVASCSDDDDEDAAPRTTTTEAPTTTSATTVPGRSLRTVDGRPATDTCPAAPAQNAPAPDRPHYALTAVVDLAADVVRGELTVRFTPDLATDRLVFRLWPNGPRPAAAGSHIDVRDVRVDGRATATDEPDPTTLVVPLPRPLAAGVTAVVDLDWELALPGRSNDRLAREGDALRLGSFFPILAWEPGVGWALDPPTTGFAEASTAPVADFDLRLTVPEGMSALASGLEVGAGHWQATAVRDVAVSIGRFETVEADVGQPAVRVVVGVDAGVRDSPDTYLDLARRALLDFNERYGQYPWPSLSLAVTAGLGGGIEYPTHIFMGPDTDDRTTPHEVAHQWFYSLVGNDQGRDPWLDEGLATWAEVRFMDDVERVLRRVVPADGAKRLGEPMTYWDQRLSAYYAGVYVQGAQAVHALGGADLVDCALRHFVARNAHRVATTDDLVAALEVVFPEARAVLRSYGAKV